MADSNAHKSWMSMLAWLRNGGHCENVSEVPSDPKVQSTMTITAPACKKFVESDIQRYNNASIVMQDVFESDDDVFYDCSDHFVEDDDYYQAIPYSLQITFTFNLVSRIFTKLSLPTAEML